MDPDQNERLDESFYRNPQWIAEQGQYLHGNNGIDIHDLHLSPFFDRQSNNNSVYLQAVSDARFQSWLATRENFEAQLRRIAGTEYVVTHDPIASNIRYKTGEISNVWVIQKQARRKITGQEDEVTPLAIYYVVGDAIYQAPTVGKLIGNRMLSTATSLNKMLSIASPLPLFSAASGHTYFPPSQKAPRPLPVSVPQQNNENTPMPDTQRSASQAAKTPFSSDSTAFEDTKMFLEALNLSRRYGKEYMDDAPLLGEPGSFRTSRVREAPAMAREASTQARQPPVPPVKERSTAPTPIPIIQTDVPRVGSQKSAKGGDRSATTPGGREKPKRRKSRPGVTPTES